MPAWTKRQQSIQNPEQTYQTIRASIVTAQCKLSAAVNSAMVAAYWEIGEQIYRACGENDRAEYEKRLLEYLPRMKAVPQGAEVSQKT